MLIRMLQTRRGTEDGFTVRQYFAGEVYEMREHLAWLFLKKGWAVRMVPERISPHPSPPSYAKAPDGQQTHGAPKL